MSESWWGVFVNLSANGLALVAARSPTCCVASLCPFRFFFATKALNSENRAMFSRKQSSAGKTNVVGRRVVSVIFPD